jgi:hypothetical protein
VFDKETANLRVYCHQSIAACAKYFRRSLRKVEINQWSDLPQFLSVITRPCMPYLQELDLRSVSETQIYAPAVLDDALVTLLDNVATCRHLRSLKLPIFNPHTEKVDIALGNCVRNSSSLKVIELCLPVHTSNAPKFGGKRLAEALKGNYNVEYIGMGGVAEIWDAGAVQTIDVLTRLNRAGRVYMTTEPTNQRLGFKVVENVNDDLDCLFFHVRVNPVLGAVLSLRRLRTLRVAKERQRLETSRVLIADAHSSIASIHRRRQRVQSNRLRVN